MDIWCKHSGADIMTNSRMGKYDKSSLTISAPRNGLVSGQIMLRDTDKDFIIETVEFIGLDSFVQPEYFFADTAKYNDGFCYPDILSNRKSVSVLKNHTQIIWISLFTKSNAPIGKKNFKIKIVTDLGEFFVKWAVDIHSFTLKEPKDSFVNHEYFFSPLKYCNDESLGDDLKTFTPYYSFEIFSDGWKELMKSYAVSMKRLRVNYVYLQVFDFLKAAGSKRIGENKWQFNWIHLDTLVEIFIKYGSVKKFSVAHIVNAVDGTTINYLDESGNKQQAEHNTPLANAWAKVFYGELYNHFKEKGWLNLLFMHIQDEPHTSESWKWARAQIKKYMPDIICGEPLDTHSVATELDGYCDIFIPRIEILDRETEFYHNMQKKGNELWAYSCCYPEECWFLNKFIDQPHQYSRLMEWTCFYKGATGFLHWGYNQWARGMFGPNPDARFKGDGFIVYPNPAENNVLDSARGMETIEGIQEWEMLVVANKNFPEEVKKIVASITKGFENFKFDKSGKSLENAKLKLLKLLDE